MFDSVIVMLQKTKPCKNILKTELLTLQTNILICFVTPEAAQISDVITNIDIITKTIYKERQKFRNSRSRKNVYQ